MTTSSILGSSSEVFGWCDDSVEIVLTQDKKFATISSMARREPDCQPAKFSKQYLEKLIKELGRIHAQMKDPWEYD